MRVFLDANILFSAAKTDGAVRKFLELLVAHGHECCADEYVVAEARRNLRMKGPSELRTLEGLLTGIRIFPVKLQPAAVADLDWLPEKDQPVLAAAIRSECQALVTGDRTHFGVGYGKTFGGVTIHSPVSLAKSLRLTG